MFSGFRCQSIEIEFGDLRFIHDTTVVEGRFDLDAEIRAGVDFVLDQSDFRNEFDAPFLSDMRCKLKGKIFCKRPNFHLPLIYQTWTSQGPKTKQALTARAEAQSRRQYTGR